MLFTGHIKRQFPYEVFQPVINGGSTTYVKRTEGSGVMISGVVGVVTLITAEALEEGEIIRNLRDSQGTLIYTADLYVNDSVPIVDPYGVLTGWRSTLRRTAPRSLDALYDRITQS